jgi:hypothetical protein
MVVDDNPADVDALLDQLLSAGFEVAVAQDGEDALEQIRRRNRELALLNHVIAASASETQPEAILQIACCELAQVFEIPQAYATLLNEQRTEATVVAEYLAPGCVPMLGHSSSQICSAAL